MSKPTAGQQYTVQSGDTIERIASIAYGDASRARDIEKVNQITQLVPGIILSLPPEDETAPQLTSDGLVMIIDRIEIQTESLRFFSSIETIADGWTAVIAWKRGDNPDLDAVIRPYSYSPAHIYLDRELIGSGRLYVTHPSLKGRGQAILECWSKTVNMVDSSLQPPYEENKVTLFQRAVTLAEPFSLSVTVDLEQDGIFDRVTATEEQTAGSHLLDLAKQRGALVSTTKFGGLLINIPDPSGEPVATIEEGVEGFSGFEAKFDGRKRFSDYRLIGETSSDGPNFAVSSDPVVGVTRFKTKTVNDTTAGEIQRAADWEKTKALSETLSLPISARGFKAPNGKRWKKGDYVILISPTLFIDEGFTMLIKSVEYSSDASGEKSILTLIPPSVYSGGEIEEPWL